MARLLGRRPPPQLPWQRPRWELLLLALVAAAALTPVYVINPQDISRICLAQSLAHGHLTADACLNNTLALDKSSYHGHFYSDKAPGLAALEIPTVAALHLPLPTEWPWEFLSLWKIRVLATGVLFLVCAFMVGRVAEGLAPGYGGVSLVAFALGTLVAPFAAANFDHVPAGTLGLAAFLLAWRRKPFLSGLAGGGALLMEYEAATILLVIGVYVALQGGWALFDYVRGALPGVGLLWTYDWLAFGAPWHPPYHYIANGLAAEQNSGFFGIHAPRLHGIEDVFVGSKGLLVDSPIVVAAAVGLVLLARRYRVEAIVCAAVAVIFLLINCGYFSPYGGVSPGPRFLIPMLPFLALGLAPAFAAAPRAAAALALASIVPMTALLLTWGSSMPVVGSIWRALVRLPADLGSARVVDGLAANALEWIGAGRQLSAGLVVLCVLAAFGLAIAGMGRPARSHSSSSTSSAPPAIRSPSRT